MARRLIDEIALSGQIQSEYHGAISDSEMKVYQVLQRLESAPTVDAVLVVRCRDCKHHRIFLKRDMCARHAQIIEGCEVGLCATREDDFCSYGEKKENDN